MAEGNFCMVGEVSTSSSAVGKQLGREQGQAEDRGPRTWWSLLGGSRMQTGAVWAALLADEVKPPPGMVGLTGGVGGEGRCAGKKAVRQPRFGEQWGALSSAWRTWPVLSRGMMQVVHPEFGFASGVEG